MISSAMSFPQQSLYESEADMSFEQRPLGYESEESSYFESKFFENTELFDNTDDEFEPATSKDQKKAQHGLTCSAAGDHDATRASTKVVDDVAHGILAEWDRETVIRQASDHSTSDHSSAFTSSGWPMEFVHDMPGHANHVGHDAVMYDMWGQTSPAVYQAMIGPTDAAIGSQHLLDTQPLVAQPLAAQPLAAQPLAAPRLAAPPGTWMPGGQPPAGYPEQYASVEGAPAAAAQSVGRLVKAVRAPGPLRHNKAEPVTSLTVNAIPCQMTRTKLCALLDETGFAGRYDYVFVPCNRDKTNRGHGFVNFRSPEDAKAFFSAWHGARVVGVGSHSPVLSVSVSGVQGFEASVQRWTVAKMLSLSDPDFRPFIAGRPA